MLLAATQPTDFEHAWSEFVAEHSDLVLRVARTMGGDHDAVMDRYAFVIDALRDDGGRRLRAYTQSGRGTFTTWLVVVVRRLCVDELRQRYGRLQSECVASEERHAQRRNLADLIGDELALEALVAPGNAPDEAVLLAELHSALSAALEGLAVSDRLVLRLRFEDGLSVPEIARATSAGSPFKLYRRIEALLKELRIALESAGVEDATP
jgi:RNA polymerase sigma factor (sigma-70 family)